MRSYSESRGGHLGGGQNQQTLVVRPGGCSVKQVDHLTGLFIRRGLYVLISKKEGLSHRQLTARLEVSFL